MRHARLDHQPQIGRAGAFDRRNGLLRAMKITLRAQDVLPLLGGNRVAISARALEPTPPPPLARGLGILGLPTIDVRARDAIGLP
jgi:hypothetical protein